MYQTILQILLIVAVIAVVVSLWNAGKPSGRRINPSGAKVTINDEEEYIDIRRN